MDSLSDTRGSTGRTPAGLDKRAYADAWRMSRTSFKNLCIDMGDILRRVEPDQSNAGTIYALHDPARPRTIALEPRDA